MLQFAWPLLGYPPPPLAGLGSWQSKGLPFRQLSGMMIVKHFLVAGLHSRVAEHQPRLPNSPEPASATFSRQVTCTQGLSPNQTRKQQTVRSHTHSHTYLKEFQDPRPKQLEILQNKSALHHPSARKKTTLLNDPEHSNSYTLETAECSTPNAQPMNPQQFATYTHQPVYTTPLQALCMFFASSLEDVADLAGVYAVWSQALIFEASDLVSASMVASHRGIADACVCGEDFGPSALVPLS